jgi:hypothetical protein
MPGGFVKSPRLTAPTFQAHRPRPDRFGFFEDKFRHPSRTGILSLQRHTELAFHASSAHPPSKKTKQENSGEPNRGNGNRGLPIRSD